jgi:hypothetical protein
MPATRTKNADSVVYNTVGVFCVRVTPPNEITKTQGSPPVVMAH